MSELIDVSVLIVYLIGYIMGKYKPDEYIFSKIIRPRISKMRGKYEKNS